MSMRQIYRSRAQSRRGWKRAATMIEFAFILPIFMFLLLFTIDMGQVILMSGAMQDATFSAVRAGAQVGGASYDARTGVAACQATGPCTTGSTYRTFKKATSQIPFAATNTVKGMSILSGGKCATTGANAFVSVRTDYSVKLITPGLNAMLGMIDGATTAGDPAWQLHATAVARCEVVR